MSLYLTPVYGFTDRRFEQEVVAVFFTMRDAEVHAQDGGDWEPRNLYIGRSRVDVRKRGYRPAKPDVSQEYRAWLMEIDAQHGRIAA